jgi:hypothetical protein
VSALKAREFVVDANEELLSGVGLGKDADRVEG